MPDTGVQLQRACHTLLGAILAALALGAASPALAADPLAANNTLYPDPAKWNHGFRPSNYDYPQQLPQQRWKSPLAGPLTKATAPAYVAAVKAFIAKDMKGLVNEPLNWTPQKAGWYDMPWGGQGVVMSNNVVDPTSGREALLGSYTGQVLQPDSYPSNPPSAPFQNHAVVYYNGVAAYHLGQVWKDLFHPDVSRLQFPEGSMVVKVEAVTLTEKQWPVLAGSSTSFVYRPPVDSLKLKDPTQRLPVVTEMRFLQMAVRVKDSVASPETGWVFVAFAYDALASGESPWDRTRPVGAMWGNDPQLNRYPDGLGPGGVLQQTWRAPQLPSFITDGLGWGGRLAGPLDLGIRHNVVTVSGKRYGDVDATNPAMLRSSSCISCHSAAQYPFIANLYPSPNKSFPPEGGQFLLYDPGSPEWARWFQNLKGNQPLSGNGRKGLFAVDYDMMLTFALTTATGSVEDAAFVRHTMAGH